MRAIRPICLLLPAALCACAVPPSAPSVAPPQYETIRTQDGWMRARLLLPDGAGPHPVVIDLHGCNGVWPERDRARLPALREAGFAVLQPDSFGHRKVTEVCGNVFRVSPMQRTLDLAAAIEYADARDDLGPIFVVGMSHGGTAVLLAHIAHSPVFRKARGMVAYYPYCLSALDALNSDLLVMIGARDDWTPASRCRTMRVAPGAHTRYELVVYDNARHSFDVPGLDARHLGHHVKYDPAAARDSFRRLLDFLRARLDAGAPASLQ